MLDSRAVSRSAVVGSALLAVAGLTAAGALADSAPNPLDPRQYLSVEWGGHDVVKICDSDPCPPPYEVIGSRGQLKIDFSRERMKELWTFGTSGSLSVLGYVVPPGVGKDRRAIEIPGYSVIGKPLMTQPLDLARASELVSQLGQGPILARTFLLAEAKAKLAALEQKRSAFQDLIEAEEELLRITETALRRVYTEALNFRLSADHLKQAASDIQAAERVLLSKPQPETAARAANLATFFAEVADEKTTVDAWLEEVLRDENRPYLPILAQIIGRNEEVIRKVATDVRDLIAQAGMGLDEATLLATQRRIVSLAETLMVLQEQIYLRYRSINQETLAKMQATPQYRARKLEGFDPRGLESPGTVLEACMPPPIPFPGVSPDERDIDAIALEKAQDRLDSIETLLRWITADSRWGAVSDKALANFKAQIKKALQKTEDLRAKKAELDLPIWMLRDELRRRAAAWEDKTCRDKVLADKEGIDLLLKLDILHALIDKIRPITLSLQGLDLDEGDRLAIVVSFIPGEPPPPQITVDFQIAPWGWRGPKPRVKDIFAFVQADEPGEDFAPSPGVTALWNFYGKSPNRKSKLRTLAPGIGVGALFLNFDGDESSIEMGLGVTLSFFDDLVYLTYGYNLQEKTLTAGNREFFGIGLSLAQVVQKFSGE